MFIQTYASHVMQTALQQANKYLTESLEEPKDALKKRPDENPLEPLSTIINLFVENLMSQLVTVCTDVNGSHVLRYLLCILMGCPHRCGDIKKHTEKGSIRVKVLLLPSSPLDEFHSRRGLRRSPQCHSLWHRRAGPLFSPFSADQQVQLLRRTAADGLSAARSARETRSHPP